MIDPRATYAAALRGGRTALRAVGTALSPVGRRAPEIVFWTAVVLSVLASLVLVGAARNDAEINGDRAESVGEVLDGSSLQRTFVRFTAADGAVLTPEHGVFYTRGLEPGNLVRVEYDRSEPDLVRVAGRNWTEGLVPVVVGILVIWAVLGSIAYGLGRLRRRWSTTASVPQEAESGGPSPAETVGAGAR